MARHGARARYTALTVAFSCIWVSAFVALKIALRDAPPLTLMCSRFFVAGMALLLLARVRGASFPRGWRAWVPIAVLGLLMQGIYFGLTSIAINHLSAGLSAVFASTNPVILAMVAPWFLGERLTLARAAGIAVSFAGVVWLMAGRLGAANAPWAAALFFACVCFFVAATILFKRWDLPYDRVLLNGGQLLTGGLVLLVPTLLTERLDAIRFTPSMLAAQVYLTVVVSCLAMLVWLWLLDHGDATSASVFFFLNPVWGLILGALLLGEPLHASELAGGVAVGLGVWMVQRA
jgi:drug/metabolite transporter (DMT)-like permease